MTHVVLSPVDTIKVFHQTLYHRKLGQSFSSILDSVNHQRKLWSKTWTNFNGI